MAPGHIGTGIAGKLMKHAKNLALEKGGTDILIQGDPNAEQFYLKSGAQLSGKKKSGSIPDRYLPLFTIPLAMGSNSE